MFPFRRSPEAGRTPEPNKEAVTHPTGRFETLARTLLAAGSLMTTMEPAHAQDRNPTSEVDISESSRENRFGFGLDIQGFVPWIDADGNTNLGKLPELAYSALTADKTEQRQVQFVIPADWSRYFNKSEFSDPETGDKIKAELHRKIRDELAHELYGLYTDQDDYDSRVSRENAKWEITGIRVIAGASPEANTPESVRPGVIDTKNETLAQDVRGNAVSNVLMESLRELNIPFDETLMTVSGEENQFSEGEYNELQHLAEQLGKQGTSDEQVWSLIKDYNRGKIADPSVTAIMDELVASKRMTSVEITMEREEKDTLLVPLALLGMALLRRRRSSDQAPQEQTPPGEQLGPEREPILDSARPNPSKEPRLFANEVAYDLNRAFDFYRPILDRFHSDENPDANDMAHRILDLWTRNDNAIRENAGLPPTPHQKNNPRQVLYANLHAQALKRLMLQARERNQSFNQAWNTPETQDAMKEAVQTEVTRLNELKEE